MLSDIVLVTGCAGFIGFHLSRHLLSKDLSVVETDNMGSEVSIELKYDRLQRLKAHPEFTFEKRDLRNPEEMRGLFQNRSIKRVVPLAARTGVRASMDEPGVNVQDDITGTSHLLETCRSQSIKHFLLASSSSVYGEAASPPFSTEMHTDRPLSAYAATNKSAELLVHSYARMHRLPAPVRRFFTVYGPWGRPDMAYFLFTKAMLEDRPIEVFNYGRMKRDFTYIGDLVDGIVRAFDFPPLKAAPASSNVPYHVYNLGSGQPITLMRFIELLEEILGVEADKHLCAGASADVPITHADISRAQADLGYRPRTTLKEGLKAFVEWYRAYTPSQ